MKGNFLCHDQHGFAFPNKKPARAIGGGNAFYSLFFFPHQRRDRRHRSWAILKNKTNKLLRAPRHSANGRSKKKNQKCETDESPLKPEHREENKKV
jgi:hypothetical protein